MSYIFIKIKQKKKNNTKLSKNLQWLKLANTYNVCVLKMNFYKIVIAVSLWIHIPTLEVQYISVCPCRYVHQLYILVNCFLRPLRMAASSKKPPINHDDVSSIFLNRFACACVCAHTRWANMFCPSLLLTESLNHKQNKPRQILRV